MEETRDTIGNNNDNHPANTIVSSMTTVTGNGTNVTLTTPQTIDNFEPDPKWEMTTLEKASYEPTTQVHERQEAEDKSVFDSCILSQSSVDTQMEKVIDDIVELDRCQQFDQQPMAGYHHNQQNIALDREKEVANIQREISGNFGNSQISEEANIEDKAQQDKQQQQQLDTTNIESNEQQATFETPHQSNQDLNKQTDDMSTPESSLAAEQQLSNDQDSPITDATSTEVNTEVCESEPKLVKDDLVDNNCEKIEENDEVMETREENESSSNIEETVASAQNGADESVESNIAFRDKTPDIVEEKTENDKEEVQEHVASETIEDEISEDLNEAKLASNDAAVTEIEMDTKSDTVETSIQDNIQEPASDNNEEEAKDEEQMEPSDTIKDKIGEVDEERDSGENEEAAALEIEMDKVTEAAIPEDDQGKNSDLIEEKQGASDEEKMDAAEEETEVTEEKTGSNDDKVEEKSEVVAEQQQEAHETIDEKVDEKEASVVQVDEEEVSSSVVVETPRRTGRRASKRVIEKTPFDDDTKIEDSDLGESNLPVKREVPTSTTDETRRRRSKRAKIEPQVVEKVEEKVLEKVEKSANLKPEVAMNDSYKCTHCDYASLRLDNLIYRMKHKLCKPLMMMWNERCNEYKKVMQKSPASKKRMTR